LLEYSLASTKSGSVEKPNFKKIRIFETFCGLEYLNSKRGKCISGEYKWRISIDGILGKIKNNQDKEGDLCANYGFGVWR